NPRIIHLQSTGYGARGPYALMPTHGQHFDAHSGAYRFWRDGEGLAHSREAEESSLRRVAGLEAGCLYGALAVAAALVERDRTGRGRAFDISCGDSGIASDWFSLVPSLNHTRVKPFQPPVENSRLPAAALVGGSPRRQLYGTREGRFVLAALDEPAHWERFCRAAGREDLLAFGGEDAALEAELRALFESRTRRQWIELASEERLAIGPVVPPEDIMTNPQVRARGVFADMRHPVFGPWYLQGSPLRRDFAVAQPTPALGEHTAELLAELGYPAEEYERLKTSGIV